MEMLNKMLAIVMAGMGATGSIALVLEFVLRMVPSEKPLSVAHLVAAGCHKLGELMSAVATWLDKVLPQKLVK